MMDTALFTAVIFVILTSAMALIFSVLGLATTHQVRFDRKDKFRREGAQQQAAISKPNEWAALRDEFNATVRERADTIEDLLDEQFRRRFSELMFRSARARHRNRVAALP
jgi:gamma-glutamyl:cysteine ligase YbdK (ATP-grasp superfamily)